MAFWLVIFPGRDGKGGGQATKVNTDEAHMLLEQELLQSSNSLSLLELKARSITRVETRRSPRRSTEPTRCS
eukprot:Skav236648  [mRNA]  locus=scaffold691:89883:90098:+ [translate_table: standard]